MQVVCDEVRAHRQPGATREGRFRKTSETEFQRSFLLQKFIFDTNG